MKRALWTLVAVLVTAGLVHLFTRPTPTPSQPLPDTPKLDPSTSTPASTPTAPTVTTPADKSDDVIAPARPKRNGRPFYGVLPQGVKDLADLPMANRPSRVWRKNLTAQIVRNGGKDLASQETTPQESYIIRDGQMGRYVERVVVTVHAKDGRFTRFFAEVDSETGHVLKTWGTVIHENPNLKE